MEKNHILEISHSTWGNFWGEKENYFNLKLISKCAYMCTNCHYLRKDFHICQANISFSRASSNEIKEKGKFMKFFFFSLCFLWVMSSHRGIHEYSCLRKSKWFSKLGQRWSSTRDANKANGDFIPFPSNPHPTHYTHIHTHTHALPLSNLPFTTHREFNIGATAAVAGCWEQNISAIYMYVHHTYSSENMRGIFD